MAWKYYRAVRSSARSVVRSSARPWEGSPVSDALLNTLTEALAELVTAIAECDDEELDPDRAVTWLEGTGHLLDRLSPADRRALSVLVRKSALRQETGPWRDALLRLPEGFGLDDDQHQLYCDAVAELTQRLLHTLRDAHSRGDSNATGAVPPEGALTAAVRRLGIAHRWSAQVLRNRADEPVSARDVPLDLPEDPMAHAPWLMSAATETLAMLRALDPELPIWTPGADRRVGYFARRLCFETVLRLADVEIALGRRPLIAPGTAADGIEEFLANLPYDSAVARRVAVLPDSSLCLAAVDTGAAWTVTTVAGDMSWRGVGRDASVRVEGPVDGLLLMVYGRYHSGDPRFGITGDHTVLDRWLAATAPR